MIGHACDLILPKVNFSKFTQVTLYILQGLPCYEVLSRKFYLLFAGSVI